jgi:hypothetical protein
MFRKTLASHARSGQVMVESVLAMIVILIVFLALFNLSDMIRAKLLVENAAAKCARARAVGYNDFMLRKIARLSTMPAAGKCHTSADSENGTLSLQSRYDRIGVYLMSEYEAQADAILDFERWQEGDTAVQASFGNSPSTATVTQHRPDDFNFGVFTGKSRTYDGKVGVCASATVEAHYPDYLQ